MIALFRKELNGFLSTLTGYLVMVVFLVLNILFIWIFPGQFNVLDGSYASLDTLFSLSPWMFLFLVPAITMRMIADERRTGTMELLYTRPLTDLQIVMSKFLASWVLIILSILPTLVFFWSVFQLGNPPGNIDTGATWGSYIGLLFLGGIYASIGIFASSLTDNQIIAFILALLLSFLCYLGFDMLSGIAGSGAVAFFISKLGISFHYEAISRGVIDTRDLVYFFSVIALFVISARLVLQKRKW